MRKFVLNLFVFFFVFYLALLIALYSKQRAILFHPQQGTMRPIDYGFYNISEVLLKDSNKTNIAAWQVLPDPAKANGKAVIVFYGNAGKIEYYGNFLIAFANEGFVALGVSYPGYDNSGGSPSEENFYNAARAGIDYLKTKVGEENISVIGQSIGSGVATQMATEYKLNSVELISPFTSIADLASKKYWYFPVKYLLKDKFDSLSKVDKINEPVLILHGNKDELVPYSLGEELYKNLHSQKKFISYDGYYHNNMPFPRMQKDITDFINATTRISN